MGLLDFLKSKPQTQKASGRKVMVRQYRAPRGKGSGFGGASGNAAVPSALGVLRSRARDLAHNNPYAARAITLLADNIAGAGVRAAISGDDAFEAWYRDWLTSTDADHEGRLAPLAQQHVVVRMMLESGDGLQVIRYKKKDGVVTPQLQVVDADLLADNASPRRAGNKVLSGVEFDPSGRIVGYHFRKSRESTETSFIEADFVLHYMEHLYPGQLRGIPCGVQAIANSEFVDEMLFLSCERAKVEVSTAYWLKMDATAEEDDMPHTGLESDDDGEGGAQEFDIPKKVGQASVHILPPGYDVTVGQYPVATGTIEYVKIGLRACATAYGVPYAAISGDYGDLNFSSYKAADLAFRRRVTVLQTHSVETNLRKLMRHVAACYELSTGKKVDLSSITWTFPGFESVEPLKDAAADEKRVSMGAKTVSQILRQAGKDPEDVFAELEKELAWYRKNNLRHPLDAGQPAVPRLEVSPEEDEPAKPPKKPQ